MIFTSSDPAVNICCHHRLAPYIVSRAAAAQNRSGVTAQTSGESLLWHLAPVANDSLLLLLSIYFEYFITVQTGSLNFFVKKLSVYYSDSFTALLQKYICLRSHSST